MKNLKRYLAILLSVCVLSAFMPINSVVFADEVDEESAALQIIDKAEDAADDTIDDTTIDETEESEDDTTNEEANEEEKVDEELSDEEEEVIDNESDDKSNHQVIEEETEKGSDEVADEKESLEADDEEEAEEDLPEMGMAALGMTPFAAAIPSTSTVTVNHIYKVVNTFGTGSGSNKNPVVSTETVPETFEDQEVGSDFTPTAISKSHDCDEPFVLKTSITKHQVSSDTSQNVINLEYVHNVCEDYEFQVKITHEYYEGSVTPGNKKGTFEQIVPFKTQRPSPYQFITPMDYQRHDNDGKTYSPYSYLQNGGSISGSSSYYVYGGEEFTIQYVMNSTKYDFYVDHFLYEVENGVEVKKGYYPNGNQGFYGIPLSNFENGVLKNVINSAQYVDGSKTYKRVTAFPTSIGDFAKTQYGYELEIRYVYDPTPTYPVTVHHKYYDVTKVDGSETAREENEELKSTDSLTVKNDNESISILNKTSYGYELQGTIPTTANKNQEITIEYHKVTNISSYSVPVTHEFYDVTNNHTGALVSRNKVTAKGSTDTITGLTDGKEFEITSKADAEYKLVNVTTNSKAKNTDTSLTRTAEKGLELTVVYEKVITLAALTADVLEIHTYRTIDANPAVGTTNQVDNFTRTGKEVGKPFTANAINKTGFTLQGAEAQTVTVAENGNTINFLYVRNVDTTPATSTSPSPSASTSPSPSPEVSESPSPSPSPSTEASESPSPSPSASTSPAPSPSASPEIVGPTVTEQPEATDEPEPTDEPRDEQTDEPTNEPAQPSESPAPTTQTQNEQPTQQRAVTQNNRDLTLQQNDDGTVMVLDENGIPLGYLELPEGTALEDFDFEEFDIMDGLIPLGGLESEPEPVPYTGDSSNASFYALAGLVSVAGAFLLKRKLNQQK